MILIFGRSILRTGKIEKIYSLKSLIHINIYSRAEVKGWYGFMGIGGSVFHWHPELRISFVFLPTYLDWTDFSMARGVKLRDIVYDCVMDIKKTDEIMSVSEVENDKNSK